MPPLEIPSILQTLLSGSQHEASTISLAEDVGTVLANNSTPFFPAYTDHGTQHVERVLRAAVRLIPDEAWDSNPPILHAADAAVLICATALHDLALHIQHRGFVELVGPDTRFKPRPWFSQDRASRPADHPWPDLWASFQREARHFGTSQIELLFGPANDGLPSVAHEEDLHPEGWIEADYLLIGEFLRRHHTRLAHEIAQYGMPGTTPETFSVLAATMPNLADAIGAVARSHGESLRSMLEYLEYLGSGSIRPSGSLLVFHMGVLRIADFLQIEADRAPPLLLMLKDPVSPLSVSEWNKHGAISSVAWEHRDPLAIDITVSAHHGLRTHLALRDLLKEMQNELDTTTAVLSEVYSSKELAGLRLTRHRVHTNLDEPSLHALLPYLPRSAALRSDPDLFRLVIRALYGNQPAVAGRELVQNAVDAVRARRALMPNKAAEGSTEKPPESEADVVVTLEEHDDGSCVLTVIDNGIGMTPDLIVDYYLQAGASFGPTPSELAEIEHNATAVAMKAGRFGIGAFAAFLLGPEIEVISRHAEALRGVSFRARINEDLVELDWIDDVPIGTEVRIPFNSTVIPGPHWAPDEQGTPLQLLEAIANFYRLNDPSISFTHRKGSKRVKVASPGDVPPPLSEQLGPWRGIECDDFDSALWRAGTHTPAPGDSERAGVVVHNGILIRDLKPNRRDSGGYKWSDPRLGSLISCPDLAVFDSKHALGITLDRFGLVDSRLPFEEDLLEGIGLDIVAHALAMGSQRHPLQIADTGSPVFSKDGWIPALPSLFQRYVNGPLVVMWRIEDYGATSRRSATTREFLWPANRVHWDDLPYRAQAGVKEHSRSELLRAVTNWGHRFRARELATVIVGDAREGHGYARLGGISTNRNARLRSPGSTRSGPRDEKLERVLTEAAQALMPESGIGSIALSAFGDFSPGNAATRRLAASWIETIGGFLDRTAGGRRRAEERAIASRPELGPLVAAWTHQAESSENYSIQEKQAPL